MIFYFWSVWKIFEFISIQFVLILVAIDYVSCRYTFLIHSSDVFICLNVHMGWPLVLVILSWFFCRGQNLWALGNRRGGLFYIWLKGTEGFPVCCCWVWWVLVKDNPDSSVAPVVRVREILCLCCCLSSSWGL